MFESEKTELDFYRSLHRSMNAVIYVLNLEPYRLEWITNNSFIPNVMGFTQEQLMAQADYIAARLSSTPDFQESVELAVEKFQEDPDISWAGVYRIKDAEDIEKWIIYSTGTLEKDDKGNPVKVVCVALDPANLLNTPLTLDAFLRHVRIQRYQSIKDGLTPKQSQVIQLILDNKSEAEIAKSMDLSVHTIRDHKKSIFKKLGCVNVKELFAVAQKYGLSG